MDLRRRSKTAGQKRDGEGRRRGRGGVDFLEFMGQAHAGRL